MKSWKAIRAQKFSPEELREIDDDVERELLEIDLRTLREAVGLTQEELAKRVPVTQSQLSKLERRSDHRISTLRRYVEIPAFEARTEKRPPDLHVTPVRRGSRRAA